MSNRHWHLISYDIHDDRRRVRTARLLEGHGQRVQHSVFRVLTTRRQLLHLRFELQRRMETPDNLLIIPIPDAVARCLPTLQGQDDWTEDAVRWKVVG